MPPDHKTRRQHRDSRHQGARNNDQRNERTFSTPASREDKLLSGIEYMVSNLGLFIDSLNLVQDEVADRIHSVSDNQDEVMAIVKKLAESSPASGKALSEFKEEVSELRQTVKSVDERFCTLEKDVQNALISINNVAKYLESHLIDSTITNDKDTPKVEPRKPKTPTKAKATKTYPPSQKNKKSIQQVEGDDLRKLPGVGPSLYKKLKDAGIVRFKQICKPSKSDLEKLSQFQSNIDNKNWVEVAEQLMNEAS